MDIAIIFLCRRATQGLLLRHDGRRLHSKLFFLPRFAFSSSVIFCLHLGRPRLPEHGQQPRLHLHPRIRLEKKTKNCIYRPFKETPCFRFAAGAVCSPVGGNGCREINARYCGGNLNFSQNVSRKKSREKKSKTLLNSSYSSICRQTPTSRFAVIKVSKVPAPTQSFD